MKITHIRFLIFVSWFFLIGQAYSQNYTIKKESDGPFRRKIGGQLFNQHSGLARQSILLNDPNCPVVVINNSLRIEKQGDEFKYLSSTDLKFNAKIVGISVIHALYDVFGRHIENLENFEIRDFTRGWATFKGDWTADPEAFSGNVHDQLITVTYINRVRLADDTLWVYDQNKLSSALASLSLEKAGMQEEMAATDEQGE